MGIDLDFSSSQLWLALVAGVGSAYLGWRWSRLTSARARLMHVLPVVAAVSLLSALAWEADRTAGWLLTMAYSLLVGVLSRFASAAYGTRTQRDQEMGELRANLLAGVEDTAAQQERNRLARELHDSIKQQLFSINVGAAAAAARWENDPQGARQALDDLQRAAQEAMVEMNALLQQLSPAPLEKVGLLQALREQCEALSYRTGAEVTAEFGDLPSNDVLPAGAQESLFRMVQEAFSNVARHARAHHVHLSLGQRDGEGLLQIEIRDDGQGFDASAPTAGMGLHNVRQRVDALDGELVVESAPGRGTAVRACIPLAGAASGWPQLMHGQAHTINKVVLAGLAGGLALVALLYYPLYVLLPGSYFADWADWAAGSQVLGLILEAVSALPAVAAGFLAARWAKVGSRQHGALLGALAGAVAGITLYAGIGAAAAGLVGHGAFLRHGLRPTADERALSWLLAQVTAGTLSWSYATFWAASLLGTGLGALGGLLAPAAAQPAGQPAGSSLWPALRIVLVPWAWIAALNLFLGLAVFSALESQIQESLAAHALPSEALLFVSNSVLWPAGSAAALYLLPLIALYFLSRGDAGSRERGRLDTLELTSVASGLLAFGGASCLLLAGPALSIALASALGLIIVATAAASLVMGGAYVATFIKTRRQRQALGFVDPAYALQLVAAVIVLWSLAMVAWGLSLPLSWGALVGAIVAAVDTALLVILRRQPRQRRSGLAILIGLQATVSQLVGAGLGAAVALVLPLVATAGSTASMMALVIRAVTVLAGVDLPSQAHAVDSALVELVRNAYVAQACMAVVLLVGSVAIVGLLVLAVSGIMAVARQRLQGETPNKRQRWTVGHAG